LKDYGPSFELQLSTMNDETRLPQKLMQSSILDVKDKE
jgi:hypothetical protein